MNGRPDEGPEDGRPTESRALAPIVRLSSLKIQNIVASCDVGFSIKLEALKETQEKFSRCHYEPELFPGLIYKMENPKVVLLIFTSGKIVLAGAKSRQQIYQAYTKIYPVLFKFKKQQSLAQIEAAKKQLLKQKQLIEREKLKKAKQVEGKAK